MTVVNSCFLSDIHLLFMKRVLLIKGVYLNIKEELIENKKTRSHILMGCVLLFVGMLLSFLTLHDETFYKTKIVKINDVSEKIEREYKNKEKRIKQTIKGEIVNGSHKGKSIELSHKYYSSQVYDDVYSKGDRVFIEKNNEGYSISGKKRDHHAVLMIFILLAMLVMVAGTKGITTFLSLIINLIVLFGAIQLYVRGINLVLVISISVILFALMLLGFNTGFSKKTYSAAISTVVSLLIATLISYLVMKLAPEPNYEFFEYLPQPYDVYDAKLIFIASIIITGLGAVMDIAVTMTSLVSEILRKNSEVSVRELKKSCAKVGDDVLGTMINVVFFSNVAAAIPFLILSLKNGIDVDKVLKYNVFFDIVRFFTGSIATVLAIPASAMVAVKIFRKREEQ